MSADDHIRNEPLISAGVPDSAYLTWLKDAARYDEAALALYVAIDRADTLKTLRDHSRRALDKAQDAKAVTEPTAARR